MILKASAVWTVASDTTKYEFKIIFSDDYDWWAVAHTIH